MVVKPIAYLKSALEMLLDQRFKLTFPEHVVVPMVDGCLFVFVFFRSLDELGLLWVGLDSRSFFEVFLRTCLASAMVRRHPVWQTFYFPARKPKRARTFCRLLSLSCAFLTRLALVAFLWRSGARLLSR